MTDPTTFYFPKAAMLDALAAGPLLSEDGQAAARAGAAALRALAAMRPHHPQAIIGKRYATLVVPFEALMAARAAVGDHDLGPVDVNALRQLHDDDRQAHYATLDRSEITAKWGAKF